MTSCKRARREELHGGMLQTTQMWIEAAEREGDVDKS